MDQPSLLAISPLDGRYEKKLSALRPIFSEYGLIKYRFTVEILWLIFLAKEGILPGFNLPIDSFSFLEKWMSEFSEEDARRIKAIENTTNHDVKALEYYIKEKLASHSEWIKWSEFVHFGCTSEDINNLAYYLMVEDARKNCFFPILNQLKNDLLQMAHQYADLPMLSRTHGQAATPTTLGKEIANTLARLKRQITQLENAVLLGKLNGASGNYNAFMIAYPDINWERLSEKFVTHLGVTFNPYTTQIEPHDTLAEFFSIFIRINTILTDFNRDIWGYISLYYFKQKPLSREIGSSTMPHKINPIDFENAEGNLGIANALFEYMITKLPISRWQRDLSDSTVLRNMGVAFAHSFLAYHSTQKGLSKLEANEARIAVDLEQHWEVLAEAIQVVMRRFNIKNAYEQLKDFTRGKKIDAEILRAFIEKLDLPEPIKKKLLTLTPSEYIGYAPSLAKRMS